MGEHRADARQTFDVRFTGDVEVDRGRERRRGVSQYAAWQDASLDDGEGRHEAVRSRRVGANRQPPTRPATTPRTLRTLSARVTGSRRIDGCELLRERLSRSDVGRSVIASGPNHADTRAQNDDAGEKEESFAFGRGWHGAKMSAVPPRAAIETMRTVPFCAGCGYFARGVHACERQPTRINHRARRVRERLRRQWPRSGAPASNG